MPKFRTLSVEKKYKTFVEENSIRFEKYCYAISINKDNSIIFVASDSSITLFQFKFTQLKYLQNCRNHKDYVTTLNNFKNNSQFISGSMDSNIVLWSLNLMANRKYLQILQGHTEMITCSVVLPKFENFIISGSKDNKIKFWSISQQKQQWRCVQTITDHQDSILALATNIEGSKVISSGQDNIILVIEQNKELYWEIRQKIQVDQYGYRLNFIDEFTITFQPEKSPHMHMYKMNQMGDFQLTKNIDIAGGGQYCNLLFPSQYNSSKHLLITKNGWNLNIIRHIKQKDLFLLQESIEFADQYVYGILSDDGEYLITWDTQSSEISIKKFKKFNEEN
ncbi:unnamed protein product [Paramecium pentaurelia]|uniref:Uncharacterized protein n=1 Tax=Paramecium pentaurelia TaxID=43138 RepID=A0A8S1Y0U6_9CILI|nr:unnamed protein product [Paramecium pentaurelia]